MSRSCAALMRPWSSGRASLLFSLASFSSALATSAVLAEDPSKSVELPPVTVDVGDQKPESKTKGRQAEKQKQRFEVGKRSHGEERPACGSGARRWCRCYHKRGSGRRHRHSSTRRAGRHWLQSHAFKQRNKDRYADPQHSAVDFGYHGQGNQGQGQSEHGDVVKYVPGIEIHQGEGNRDQISLRGQNASTADFCVNGVRDDAQVFRDLYNTERLEMLKGPAALAFGRGGAGGVLNRVTKQADFATHDEATVEVGSFDHKRAVIDVDRKITADFGARITSMFEDSGSYRDGVDLQRWG